MAFVRIEAGELVMGSVGGGTDAFDGEEPHRAVRIGPFLLGAAEVTQREYVTVMRNNPSFFSARGAGGDQVIDQSTDWFPVENVSWLDAVKFCNAMSEKDDLTPYYDIAGDTVRIRDIKSAGYRLPTEAEWEYACRGGMMTSFSFGEDPSKLGEFAWYERNAGGAPHAVGLKPANTFGLHDMHGNVWEWCWDLYDANYYAGSPAADSGALAEASYRVARGGCWCFGADRCRSAVRVRCGAALRSNLLGFRLVRGEPGG
jgi:formylglycine-generating enzyme required for sulfatase activity